MGVYKFTAEFLVRANDKAQAETAVAEEMGADIYESHFICEDAPETDAVDVDVTK